MSDGKKLITKFNSNYVQRESGMIIPYSAEDEHNSYFPKNYDLIAHYVPYLYETQPRCFVEDCRLDKDSINRRYVDSEKQAYEIAQIENLPFEEGKILDPRKLQKYVKKEKTCRFCRRTKPDVKFNEKAHAISEQIGNHTLFFSK